MELEPADRGRGRGDSERGSCADSLLHPDARGLGAGRRLLEDALAFSRAAGHRSIFLWTVVSSASRQDPARAAWSRRRSSSTAWAASTPAGPVTSRNTSTTVASIRRPPTV